MALPVPSRGADLVPSGDEAPVFARYRDRTFVVVTAGTVLATTALLPAAMVAGLVALQGIAGVVAGAGVACTAGFGIGMWMTSTANRLLRARVRSALGARARGVFVGLRAMQGGLLKEVVRKETDDNVGFLELEEARLRITTESGVVTLEPDAIRGFVPERVKAIPYLAFVRVELSDGSSMLLISREGDSLRAMRRATERLRSRLVTWHAEHHLRWLDGAREEP